MLGAMPEGTIVVRVPRESSTAILLRSDAILEIWRTLGGVLGLLSGPGRLVPRIIRDGVYRFIAKRRTRWTPGACVVPGDRPNTIFLP